ncbi:MAG: hypothetical protein WAN87_08655 [Thermoplasmata archaeon]
MAVQKKGHPLVPIILGSAMLVVVLAAALTPNFGSVAAQSSCPYGNCTSGSGSAFPWTWLFVGLAIIIAAIILALLLISRRRRNPPASTQPWVPGGAGSTGGAPGSPPSTGTTGVGAAGGTSPAYVESASDIGTVPATAAVVGAGTAGGAAAGYAEGSAAGGGDIDSLMAELEKISGEILKKGQSPKKGNGDSTEGTADAGKAED